MKQFFYFALLLAFAMGLLLLDFYSKAYVYSFVPSNVDLFHDFMGIDGAITLAFNRGAAWGTFERFQSLILCLRIAVIVGMLCYLFFFVHDRKRDIPLVLILAGAFGNVVDTFLYGSVIDFLRFTLWGYPFPIFNVADSLITVGVFSFFIVSLFQKKDVAPIRRPLATPEDLQDT